VPVGQHVIKPKVSQMLQCEPGRQQKEFSQHSSGAQQSENSLASPHVVVPAGHTQRPLTLTLGARQTHLPVFESHSPLQHSELWRQIVPALRQRPGMTAEALRGPISDSIVPPAVAAKSLTARRRDNGAASAFDSSSNDWSLIRHSPCPDLLLRRRGRPFSPSAQAPAFRPPGLRARARESRRVRAPRRVR
jgi:hypothetical protein